MKAGASEIYAVELSAERKQKAEELGAIVIDPRAYDVVKELHRRTGGVDVAFEVTGVPPVLNQAINSTKIGGQIMIVSIFETSAPIVPNDVVMKERNITGIIGYRDVFPAVISLMEKGFFRRISWSPSGSNWMRLLNGALRLSSKRRTR